MRPGTRDLVALLVVAAVGIFVSAPRLWTPVQWSPDGLFYEAQAKEVRGENRWQALREVFTSPLADREIEQERTSPPALRRIENPAWVDYSSRFYRRRWVVPILTAALMPLAGSRSLEDVSILGLALLAPLLFVLLRFRFSTLVSAVTAVFCTVLPPVLLQAPHPNTDFLGLSLLVGSLIAAMLVAERGPRWMPLWVVLMLALSFTRDATLVAICATAWLAWRNRSKRMLVAAALGVLASLPALIAFSAPLQQNLAYVLNDYRIPTETGWAHILAGYPGQLAGVVKRDLFYPAETALPPLTLLMGAVVVAGLAMIFRPDRELGDLMGLARGSAVGAAITIVVSVNYTQLRLEFVFIPAVAIGVAALLEELLQRTRVAERLGDWVEPASPRSPLGKSSAPSGVSLASTR